jgi:hypothetical protein
LQTKLIKRCHPEPVEGYFIVGIKIRIFYFNNEQNNDLVISNDVLSVMLSLSKHDGKEM